MGTMARNFYRTRKTMNDLTSFHKELMDLVNDLCPFKKGDRVELIQTLKYFSFNEIGVGAKGSVSGLDYNNEYRYLISVAFDEIPRRYFWMPPYLFRNADWENKGGNTFERTVGTVTLKVEPVGELYLCRVVDKGKIVMECTVENSGKGMDLLGYYFNTYRMSNR